MMLSVHEQRRRILLEHDYFLARFGFDTYFTGYFHVAGFRGNGRSHSDERFTINVGGGDRERHQ